MWDKFGLQISQQMPEELNVLTELLVKLSAADADSVTSLSNRLLVELRGSNSGVLHAMLVKTLLMYSVRNLV